MQHTIPANEVLSVLGRHQLVDGYHHVFDMERSHGVWLHDAADGRDYLDGFTNFASWPIGYNHPAMTDPDFVERMKVVALNNPANSDLYTRQMAEFVEAFATRVTPPGFPHHFWVAGGALAVENGLKTAFDWKARKMGCTMSDVRDDLAVLHFREAFHGRTGYTMSLTNTDPVKIALFPKFAWPRVSNPKVEFDLEGEIINDIEAAEQRTEEDLKGAFASFKERIAAIIIEPMQGEGGDNHFRPQLFAMLRRFADENEALLIYDEVQTGFFGSGKTWMWQHPGVAPDIVAFGKKSQVCGIYASDRVDEVKENVFAKSGRINSTWGGNLTDMVRCTRFIEIIEGERLADNITQQGRRFVEGLRAIARDTGGFHNVRGVGSLVAFTMGSPADRDAMIKRLSDGGVLALKSGPQAIRFRLPLVINEEEVDLFLERIRSCAT